jgi:leucyl/phenylalanyl-tRNA--protein transferase
MLALTSSGHFIIGPGIDTDVLIDVIIASNYDEEFCISRSFSPGFVAQLMYSGFLVMSAHLTPDEADGKKYILLPKHHLTRNVLFFDDLHVSKTVRRIIDRSSPVYELRMNTDYDRIVENCVARHGDDWLTKPLLGSLRRIRKNESSNVFPCSFGLYRDDELCAGEFGVATGRVYTSYSGYRDGNSEGAIQMILTACHLKQNDFDFWDLGMPLNYKYTLGAHDIGIREFTKIFRAARKNAS